MTKEEDDLGPLRQVYAKLLQIRKREDLKLKPNPILRDELEIRGKVVPFRLRYYQIQAILHLVSMTRFVLGDDTGTGKTLTTITSMAYVWEKSPEKKALVLTTKSAVQQWASEFDKFTVGVKVFTLDKETTKKRQAIYREFLGWEDSPCVLVMNYAKIRSDFIDVGGDHDLGLQHWNLGFFVMDEVTAIKNPTATVSKCAKHIADRAERVWGLSATIIKNNLMEGFGIYRTVVPGLFGSKNAFMNDYCQTRMQQIPGSNRKIPVITGYTDEDIERFRAKIDPFFIGRAKIDVADELPVLTTREITVGLSKHQREIYDEALSGLLVVENNEGEEEEKEVTPLTAVTYCQQIVNHPSLIGREGTSEKFDALVDLLLEGDLAEEKVIVFTRFKGMVDLIVPLLNKKAKKSDYAVRVTGDESGAQRRQAQEKFQDPQSETRVVCITMAGSDAINLQMAKAIVFYDLPFSAGDYIQILGRMIRLGSEHDSVYALHMIARGTIDRRINQILSGKMDVFEKVLGKRIKQDGGTVRLSASSGLNELFAMLQRDAVAKHGGSVKPVGHSQTCECGKPVYKGSDKCIECNLW